MPPADRHHTPSPYYTTSEFRQFGRNVATVTSVVRVTGKPELAAMPNHGGIMNTPETNQVRHPSSEMSGQLNSRPQKVTFTRSIKLAYSKYATFSGRASRSEYWGYQLFHFLTTLALNFYASVIAYQNVHTRIDSTFTGSMTSSYKASSSSLALNAIVLIWSVANYLPLLSSTWRRLHDTNRSGWWAGGWLIWSIIIFVPINALLIVTIGSTLTGGITSYRIPLFGLIVIYAISAIIYGITMLIHLTQQGDAGDNKYGPGYAHS